MIMRLLVFCSSLGSNGAAGAMTRLQILLLTSIAFAVFAQSAPAQEAVSTTTSSGTGSSSTSATSSTGSTTEISTGTSSTGVSNAPTAETGIQSSPGGSGVFSPTPVKIYITVSGGYDDNVNTNLGSKQGSTFTSGNVILDYTFGDPRLQLILNAGAGGVYYINHVSGQEYDIDLKGAIGINYKASPRLTLGTTLLLDYLTEPSFDSPGGLNSRNGNYFYTSDNFFVTYEWSRRFSTKTSYTLEAYEYDNNAVGMFSNRTSHTFGNEFRFQMVPTTLLVAEGRYGIVSYQTSSLDSTTYFALGGIDHTFNPRFSGSIRGGAQFRSYDSDGDRTSPYFEGTLNYTAGRRTSVSWNTHYGLEEPDAPGAQSRTTFRTGLHTKFDFTSRVSSSLDVYYVHDDYHSLTGSAAPVAPFSEDSFDIGVALHYAITPLIGVQASYHYTDVTSDFALREYSRNRISGGLSFTF
jgi:Putative beta-barrel porin 2